MSRTAPCRKFRSFQTQDNSHITTKEMYGQSERVLLFFKG